MNILKILIIEDTVERINILKQLYRKHAWINVNTAERANKLVTHYKFDLISLDFDLAGQQTGDVVAKHITNGINKKTKVVVHSMNPTGRNKIKELIPHAIIFPISAMTKTNELFKSLREELNTNGINFDWSGFHNKFG